MTTYTLPEVPRVTIERNRREVRLVREVRDHKTGKPRQIGFKMFNAAETLEIGYALLHVAEEIQQRRPRTAAICEVASLEGRWP